jgi:PDZ domain-containing protein
MTVNDPPDDPSHPPTDDPTDDEALPGPSSRRPPAFWWPLGVIVTVAAVAVVAIVLAASISVPYYTVAPGSAVDVGPLVRVVDGPAFPPKGSVLLCTVSVGKASALDAFLGWLDPDTDVVEEKVIAPVGGKELRRLNLQAMDTSKEQALGVAFEALGYDAIREEGARIERIEPGSAADGPLRPGDVITAVDSVAVTVHREAVQLLGERRPGDTVVLGIRRDSNIIDVPVRLGANPDRPDRPLLGVTLGTSSRFEFPYDVDIASEQIGGPSAGLAFTLEVLDVLTDGELTGGIKVAATGTIELDGTVGQVGGVAQKTVAVREAGAELFLVPKAELAQARARAGDRLTVKPVETLQDALRVLATYGGNGLALGRPGTGST